jgi:hypothetical protein
LSNLSKKVKAAKSVKQVKATMKTSVKAAMSAKKGQLLKKASEVSGKKTEQLARREADRKMKIEDRKGQMKLKKFRSKAKAEEAKTQAKEQRAMEELARAKAKRRSTESAVRARGRLRNLKMGRTDAEEKAKTATALRLAAEENAKRMSAKKIAAEEEAKRAAALRVATKLQAKTAEKSPTQIRSMEAAAFRTAAMMKQKEGEALQKLAEMKTAGNAQKRVDSRVKEEATDKGSLAQARAKLRSLVGVARNALMKAKSQPFNKVALQRVVALRKQVKAAKNNVLRLSASVKKDKVGVASMEARARSLKNRSTRVVKKVVMHVQKKRATKKYSLKHPDLNHMTKKQIKYWANKKMKWRAETPMKKTRVMQKIFQLKNMEAKTLTKMNEINIGIGMNSTGIRAKSLKKGRNVIVNGELIKPGAIKAVHVNNVFQGQKGRNPKTENKSRDPKSDKMKMRRGKTLIQRVSLIKKGANTQVKAAISARTETGKPLSQKRVVNLKQLKGAVQQNKAAGLKTSGKFTLSSGTSNRAGNDEELGDANEDINMPALESKDDEEIENEEADMMEREDEDELSDDTDMSEALDETSLTGNINNAQAARRE